MPTYSYSCTACEHNFDTVQKFTDPSLTDCPECSGRLRKLFSSVGIVFKGSGFYRNDSRSSPVDAESGSNGKSESSSNDKSESGSNGKSEPDSNGKSKPGSESGSTSSGSSSESKSRQGSASSSSASSSATAAAS